MKKMYKHFLSSLINIPVRAENIKTSIFEWIAIIRKRPLYKHIKWSKAQQWEFDSFWKKNYGKKISNRWHKLYQSINGTYRVDYIPEIIYTTKIERNFNDFYYARVLSDKTMLSVLFDNRIPGVRTPKTYVANSFGNFYDGNHKIICEAEAKQILNNIGECVIKPAVDSSSGANIMMLDIQNGINTKDRLSVDNILNAYGSNYIIQEKIQPHESLKEIYPYAINTFRITSYVLDGKVGVAPIALRIGSAGGIVDNIHSGGIGITVNDDGSLNNVAYKLGFGDKTDTFKKHPDTGVVFSNIRFNFIEQLILSAKSLHSLLSNIGVISWDFTVDANGDIIIIEANLRGQGVWFPQMISAKSLLGEDTQQFLLKLKDL